jgi:hypothetical protein
MASAISQAVQGPAGASGRAAAPAGGGLAEGFAGLKQLVSQQLALSAEEREAATAGLDALLAQLTSPTATMDDVDKAYEAVVARAPWLEAPLKTLLSSPAPAQALGQIAARSL